MKELEDKIVDILKIIYDFEILVDIYELGFIYEVKISKEGIVDIDMIFILFNCLVVESLLNDVK